MTDIEQGRVTKTTMNGARQLVLADSIQMRLVTRKAVFKQLQSVGFVTKSLYST